MDSITTIQALGDNFAYLYRYDDRNALVVDPSDSSSVLQTARKYGLSVALVLVTHHHWDHIAGAADLKRVTGCGVIGSDEKRIPGIDRVVSDGEILTVGERQIRVIATPGHTRTSVSYYLRPAGESESGAVWTGDTMFVGGCGRLLECDAEAMWDSLQSLACLPDRTLVYCGHDYTAENYEFALGIEPDNTAVRRRLEEVRRAESEGRPTVPSTMAQERATNPFLRAGTPEIKKALNMSGARAAEVFAELRRCKDVFG
ncbi:MAG: hydroxyacylglutathione hydrolase [Planctomycetota bacterium]|jgi:hydroxyacylglutathione hydrolase